MKRFAIVGLSMLCLSLATTTPVKAGTRTERIAMSTAPVVSNPASTKITPFVLVSLAYQGEYRTQGIPSFGSFLAASSNKTVTAKDLVTAAIAAKQLTPDTQNDIGYLNAVDLQLLVNRN
jgi:hypothetical protein